MKIYKSSSSHIHIALRHLLCKKKILDNCVIEALSSKLDKTITGALSISISNIDKTITMYHISILKEYCLKTKYNQTYFVI
jgi:hypothetical protein